MVLQFLVVNPTISALLAILHYEHLLVQVEWLVRPIALFSVVVAFCGLVNLYVDLIFIARVWPITSTHVVWTQS